MPKGAKLAILVGLLFAALFFTKITGAIAGAIILTHALLAGRIGLWTLSGARAVFLGICAVIEISGGIVSAYIRDILILASMNSGGLLARFRSPVVMYLDILFPMVLLAMLLAWTERHRILFVMSPRAGLRMRTRIAMIFDQDVFWIVMLVAVAIFFETQNTGSLAFIFAWPYLASVFARWKPGHRDRRTAVLLLIALTALPMVMPMLHRTIRVTAATTIYDPLKEPALGRDSAVEARSELLERAYAMNRHYGEAGENYRKLFASGHQSSYLLYSEIDFQMPWLIGAARAVEALARMGDRSTAAPRPSCRAEFR